MAEDQAGHLLPAAISPTTGFAPAIPVLRPPKNTSPYMFSIRPGIVEPVFGQINAAIGIKRFTVRGNKKSAGSGSSWPYYTT
ncbi:MAG TPA: hypothetical protein VJ974_03715 [Geopsychrobacteraceae bacterium]|nr:hypothetical protein [Geopsychrobacteraceae bacterium]